uniref:Uncharacterized protein n=1 Tax=Coccolithus braarudii TaxID=221442 RepID=A0A7S0L5V2_9EUKA
MRCCVSLLALLFASTAAFSTSAQGFANFHARAMLSSRRMLHTPMLAQEMPNLDGTGSFRTLVEYPCELSVKVIGLNEGAFVSDMRTMCAGITGQEEELVGVRWRDKGKYRSITLQLQFQDADMVYAVYAAINKDPRVKFKL